MKSYHHLLYVLGYPNRDHFDPKLDSSLKDMVRYLEDRKIRFYEIEERKNLYDSTGSQWRIAFNQYLQDIECPYTWNFEGEEKTRNSAGQSQNTTDNGYILRWLLSEAISFDFDDQGAIIDRRIRRLGYRIDKMIEILNGKTNDDIAGMNSEGSERKSLSPTNNADVKVNTVEQLLHESSSSLSSKNMNQNNDMEIIIDENDNNNRNGNETNTGTNTNDLKIFPKKGYPTRINILNDILSKLRLHISLNESPYQGESSFINKNTKSQEDSDNYGKGNAMVSPSKKQKKLHNSPTTTTKTTSLSSSSSSSSSFGGKDKVNVDIDLQHLNLPFHTTDYMVDQILRALYLLYLSDLRLLQDDVNALLEVCQSYTANPATNADLGKVGR